MRLPLTTLLVACFLTLVLTETLSARHASQTDTVAFVVHISVDGLRPDAVTVLGPERAPNLHRLRSEGAFTDNARTDDAFTNTLPNHAGMLTGRRVTGANGHGVTFNDTHPGTFASVHGSYVAGVFDVAHDRGLRTGLFYSKDKFDFYARSWDAGHGAPDTIGVDNGKSKIDRALFLDNTGALTEEWLADMVADPYHYSFIHFRDPDTFGHAREWMSAQYLDAVALVDGYLGRILDLIENDSTFAGKTAIVLTADHGGSGTNHNTRGEPLHFTIPQYVWGPGVDPGADLYELNWDARRSYCMTEPGPDVSIPPVRNGGTGNLALSLLGLPPIPGSTINIAQDLRLSLPEGVLLPEVAFQSPSTNQQFFTGEPIPFGVDATSANSSIAKVVFELACDTIGTATEAPFIANWAFAPPGSHVALATAFDTDGRFSVDTVTVLIEAGVSINGSDADWLALGVTPISDTDQLQKDAELALDRLLFYEDDESYFFAFDARAKSKRIAYGLYLDLDGLRGDQLSDPLGHAVKGSRQHTPEMAFYFVHDGSDGWTDNAPMFFQLDAGTGQWQAAGWPSMLRFSADTALGFAEFSFPKSVIENYPGAMGMFASLVSVGDLAGAGPSDTIPSDDAVAFTSENSSTESVVISNFHNFTFPAFVGEKIKIDGNRFDWLGSPIPQIRNTDAFQTDVELAPNRFFVTHDIDSYYFAFQTTPGPKQVTFGLYIDSGDHPDPSRGTGGTGSANGNAVEAINFTPDVQIYFDNDTTGSWTVATPRYYFWDNTASEWTTVAPNLPLLPEGSAFGTAVFGGTSFIELAIPRDALGLYDAEALKMELFSIGSTPGAGASATIPSDPNVTFTEENTSTDVTVLSSPHTYTTRPVIVGTESPEELPTAIQLSPNYPNPFRTTTTLSFSVDRPQRIRLAAYDMLGRQHAVLIDRTVATGQHRVTVDASDLASGTYILRLESDQGGASRKMVVVK